MQLRLDSEKCQGHGRCYALSPDLFEADDEGYAVLRVEQVPAELERQARAAVDNCPEFAIELVD